MVDGASPVPGNVRARLDAFLSIPASERTFPSCLGIAASFPTPKPARSSRPAGSVAGESSGLWILFCFCCCFKFYVNAVLLILCSALLSLDVQVVRRARTRASATELLALDT